MLRITLNKVAQEALFRLMQEEGEEDSCFRFREFTSGCGASCRTKVHRVLRITLDRPEEGDLCTEVMGVKFVMDEVLTANYGRTFFITLDVNQVPAVWPLRPLLR